MNLENGLTLPRRDDSRGTQRERLDADLRKGVFPQGAYELRHPFRLPKQLRQTIKNIPPLREFPCAGTLQNLKIELPEMGKRMIRRVCKIMHDENPSTSKHFPCISS